MFPRHSKDPVEQEMNESREDYVKTIYALKLMRQTDHWLSRWFCLSINVLA